MEWSYNENRTGIILEHPPKQRLRISGHRLSTVLGLNPYATPFMAWAEITKTIKVPFVENKYIIAGRTIEPKAIDYVRNKFPNIMSMEEYFGNTIDDYRYNNFKDDSNVFGGVFDFVSTKNDGKTITMIGEVKTTGKPQLFENNNVIPEYLLQAALYARLKGLDKVLFVVCFLQDMDYAHPENFVPNETNTKLIVKKLNECFFEIDGEYLDIDGCMEKAKEWWNKYIETGVSPEFDEEKDKEYLDILRKSKPSNDTGLTELTLQGIELAKKIKDTETTSGITSMKKELNVIEHAIKEEMIKNNLDCVGKYNLKRNTKMKFNEKQFAHDNEKLYNKYITEEVFYTLSKDMKEGKDGNENSI